MEQFVTTRQYLAHADDVLTSGRLLGATERVVTRLKEASLSTGNQNKIREDKQKCNKSGVRSGNRWTGIRMGLKSSMYLGTLIKCKKKVQ
jgi:hypothetical protein